MEIDKLSASDVDSDDEPVVVRKKKTNTSRVMESDSDSQDEESVTDGDQVPVTAPKHPVGPSFLNNSAKSLADIKSNEYDSDKENINPKASATENLSVSESSPDHEHVVNTSTVRRLSDVRETLGELEAEPAEQETLPVDVVVKDKTDEEITTKSKEKYADLFDAEDSEVEEEQKDEVKSSQESSAPASPRVKSQDGSRIMKHDKLLSELFDAEESDEGERSSDSEEEEEEKREEERNSEGSGDEEPREMSAALKKRLAKGAAKKPGKAPSRAVSRAPRVDKDELQELHSETQRMVRERSVHIPYHQPKKLGLDLIVARTKQKQEALQKIKGPKQVGWKQAEMIKLDSISQLNCDIKPQEKHALDVIIDSKTDTNKDVASEESGDEMPDLVHRLKCKQTTDSPTKAVRKALEFTDKSNSSEAIVANENSSSDAVRGLSEKIAENSCDEKRNKSDEQSEANKDNIVTLTNIEVNDESVNTTTKDDAGKSEKPEQDSGYLTTPAPSSGEDSSGSHKADTAVETETAVPMDTEPETSERITQDSDSISKVVENNIIDKQSSTKSDKNETDICDKNKNDTEESEQNATVTPQLSKLETKRKKLEALGVVNPLAPPRLSGGPDAFIDLDEEEGGHPKGKAADPGVLNLIQRFMQHSAKRPKHKAKDVEISTVTKQRVEGGEGEELKLEKIQYHCDSEEEETDQEAIPGAKLLKLKSRLREQMSRDREKARALRTQAEQYENEEGFEEEEVEMTDSEESEDELGEEEEEEEELDEDEYGRDEQPQERNPFVERDADVEEDGEQNPFVDREADVEEDEEEYEEEGEMHLQLDSNDAHEEEEKRAEISKGFLKKAFSKTKSMPLFEDDEVEGSQSGTTGISERPFGKISQGKTREEMLHNVEEGDTLDNAEQSFTADKDLSVDSSFELMGSMLPPGQRSSKKPRPPSPNSNSSSALTKAKSSRPFSPIENTQDLFTFPVSPAAHAQSSHVTHSQPISFHLEESQSMLDADGFIKVKSAAGNSASRRHLELTEQLGLSDSQAVDPVQFCSGNFSMGSSSKPNESKASRMAGLLSDTQGGGDSMDELMALCSGQFSGSTQNGGTQSGGTQSGSSQAPPLSGASTGFETGGMTQLLDLCSGKFTAGNTQIESTPKADATQHKKDISSSQIKKKKRAVIEDDDETDTVAHQSKASTDKHKKNPSQKNEQIKDIVQENQEESESENDDEPEEDFIVDSDVEEEPEGGASEDEEDAQARNAFSDVEDEDSDKENDENKKFTSLFQGKSKKLRRDFVDEEAELSGSEAESDENDDLGDEFDVMEAEEGDLDVNMTEEALRDQVNRVHMKTVQDEEDRALRLMKEYYLADGDLHSEGGGRMRRFRWANIDADMEGGGMGGADDGERGEEEEEAMEEKWRLQRYERDRFLQQQKENSSDAVTNEDEEASIKFGNVLFKQKKINSITRSVSMKDDLGTSKQNSLNSKESSKQAPTKQNGPQHFFKVPKFRSGSLLHRGKDTLAKIANLSKPVGSVSGPRHSRSLLFSASAPDENSQEGEAPANKPQLKRSISTPNQPAAKKQKLERTNTLPTNSIFKLLN